MTDDEELIERLRYQAVHPVPFPEFALRDAADRIEYLSGLVTQQTDNEARDVVERALFDNMSLIGQITTGTPKILFDTRRMAERVVRALVAAGLVGAAKKPEQESEQ